MTQTLAFPSATARFSLPMLFAGQAQKEFFVNEAHALTDILLHACVEGESAFPPAEPREGECWIVGASASGSWHGHDGEIAGYQAGNWLFIKPAAGMQIHDNAASQNLFYSNGWQRVPAMSPVEGGTTIDLEARNTIGRLIEALQTAKLLPPSAGND